MTNELNFLLNILWSVKWQTGKARVHDRNKLTHNKAGYVWYDSILIWKSLFKISVYIRVFMSIDGVFMSIDACIAIDKKMVTLLATAYVSIRWILFRYLTTSCLSLVAHCTRLTVQWLQLVEQLHYQLCLVFTGSG